MGRVFGKEMGLFAKWKLFYVVCLLLSLHALVTYFRWRPANATGSGDARGNATAVAISSETEGDGAVQKVDPQLPGASAPRSRPTATAERADARR